MAWKRLPSRRLSCWSRENLSPGFGKSTHSHAILLPSHQYLFKLSTKICKCLDWIEQARRDIGELGMVEEAEEEERVEEEEEKVEEEEDMWRRRR